MVTPQNRQDKEVTRRIFQDKELRDVSASVGRFRLEGGAKRSCRDDDLKEDFWGYCATAEGNYPQAPLVRPEARFALARGS
jgi:hypothetical protein